MSFVERRPYEAVAAALCGGVLLGLIAGATLRNFPEPVPGAEAAEVEQAEPAELEPTEPLAVPPGSLGADVFIWHRDHDGTTGVRLVGHGWKISKRPPAEGTVQ